jgi:site-specific recombinase XerD
MNLDEAIERYEINARAKGYSFRTIAHVKRCVGFFAGYLGEVPDISVVSGDNLRQYLSSLRGKMVSRSLTHEKERTLSQTSINTYARAIKSFWAWLKEEGFIKQNFLSLIKTPKKSKTVSTVYTEVEIKTVLKAVAALSLEKAIVELFLDSGIRLEELSTLKVSDVDLINNRIKVLGKGGRERFAYFSQITKESLDSYLKKVRPQPQAEDYFFLTKNGHRLTSKRIQDILENIGEKAGLSTRLSAHRLRRTYATLALKYGSNLEYVRITLGHSDVKTTSQAYVSIVDDDIAAAYKKFSPIVNLMQAELKGSPQSELANIVNLPVEISELPTILPPEPLKKQGDIHTDIKELSVFTANLGGVEFNATLVIQKLWAKFELGISRTDVVEALTKLFPSDNPGIEYFDATDSLLGELSLFQIIRSEQRRMSNVRVQWDETFWVLTDIGKKVVRYLRSGA